MSAGTLVTASGVAKRYSHRGPSVLQGVNGRLTAGMVTRLSGPNGAGPPTGSRPPRPGPCAVSPAMYTARDLPRSRAAGTLASLAVASTLFTGVALAGAVRLARAR